jgi:hypothetical protein
MLASSGGVLKDSAMLTRTNGVLAISEMLAVGACCASAAPDCTRAADKATAFRNFADFTESSPQFGPPVKPLGSRTFRLLRRF